MAFPRNTSNEVLVNYLKRAGNLSDDRVRDVMLAVDRADFSVQNPYEDCPQPIGFNATISAPHMVSVVGCAALCCASTELVSD
ncbi:unnamed protein product [Gongylonema pulchrum]|uniref:protein-L-isoaspartate(D-aspartate) O-methyltransferase n=1 Tax=Gongylonema pulchrum TaxID=637853 RepID=A0A183DD69_9BILA|nr:unnamed protein product [Gongylonema pulchrum]